MDKELKKCSKCKEIKNKDEFNEDSTRIDNLSYICRKCSSIRGKKYHAGKVLHKINQREKKYCLVCGKDITAKIITAIYCSLHCQGKDYFQKNKKKRCDYIKLRKKTIPIVKARITICDLISKSFKRKGWKKDSRTQEILGCTFEFFKQHIEKQFTKGMTWENHGAGKNKWNYDHIIPVATAKTKEDVEILNHFSNFQSLWAIDNLRKSNKLVFI